MATDELPLMSYREQWADEIDLAPGRHLEHCQDIVRSLAEQFDWKAAHSRLIGQCGAWQDVLKKAVQVAATETNVLLQGASGTGKEVVARLIHRASPRKGGPFVAISDHRSRDGRAADDRARAARERWNRIKAAKRLGLTRTQLYGRLRKYGVDRPAAE